MRELPDLRIADALEYARIEKRLREFRGKAGVTLDVAQKSVDFARAALARISFKHKQGQGMAFEGARGAQPRRFGAKFLAIVTICEKRRRSVRVQSLKLEPTIGFTK